jgi:hypothetical protein
VEQSIRLRAACAEMLALMRQVKTDFRKTVCTNIEAASKLKPNRVFTAETQRRLTEYLRLFGERETWTFGHGFGLIRM